MIDRYCISHKRPLLPEDWYDHCIALGDFRSESVVHVSQLDRFWHEARPIAYGAAGTYVLPIAIQRFSSDADFIEISNYRKRILPSAEGLESYKFPTLRELNLENFGRAAELSVFIPRAEHEFLIAQPLHVKNSILGHYAAVHRRQDILDYTSLAVEMGILDSQSASEFLAAKHFIPGGIELGIYPKGWLVQTLSSIELLGREFLNRYGSRVKKYNAFQIRAVGFLSERLGSFILIRHLVEKYSNNIPADIFGYMTVIVEGDSRYSAGLTDRPRNRLDSYNRKHRQVR
ncbi:MULTISPECIES: hypothetical protein [unclassified Mycobacterium]|uniref:hypothetical protein n=1 Tax=unclassified Mycobacterium TaxID=2642494 RepID=UPI000AC2D82C|nr:MULTISPECIES: hypothetical protein [unclassified Mycobacterium]